MAWLKKQHESVLEHWIRRTRVAMLATMPDGEILWCNEALEDLLGFTSVELVGKITWKDLTADPNELKNDLELVKETVEGKRFDYQLQKPYRTKAGAPRMVVIDVMRYPMRGDFQFFLVTAIPVDQGVEVALTQLNEIRKLIIEMMDHRPRGLLWSDVVSWFEKRPIVATIISVVIAALLFGERVVELIMKFLPIIPKGE